jgi:hypothetical protein
MSEYESVEERLERLEEALTQLQTKDCRRISRNSAFILLLRVTLISTLGFIGLLAALLSAANYETKVGNSTASFRGEDFKGTLQIIAGFAATGTGVLGFGDRLLKKDKEDDD